MKRTMQTRASIRRMLKILLRDYTRYAATGVDAQGCRSVVDQMYSLIWVLGWDEAFSSDEILQAVRAELGEPCEPEHTPVRSREDV